MTRLVALAVIITACMCASPVSGQKLMGLVFQKNQSGVDEPVPGANVFWLGTSTATTTGANGIFRIDRVASSDRLVISFIGLVTDTVLVTDQASIRVQLKEAKVLDEVVVEGWKPATGLDHSRGVNTFVMSEKELFKAACCNLSESFETNPSVDVAFTDAVTGTRQIQMLGLSGPNTLISVENMPAVRGLAASQGIQLIPGTWINSIEVTKGVGPVVNGYESIAGQLNVELKKPQESEKLYLNGYVNNSGRSEANINYTAMAGKKWATTFLLHGSTRPFEMDQNNDTFLDFPLGGQLNAVNRWVFNSGNGWLAQFGVKILSDTKEGGQTSHEMVPNPGAPHLYKLEIDTKRYEAWGKLGYQFPAKPYKSIGLQLSAARHEHDSYYGFNTHQGEQQSGYANLIYQSIIGTTQHRFKTGLSLVYDKYDEWFENNSKAARIEEGSESMLMNRLDFSRTEVVPGAFAEYTYDYLHKVSVIAGLRVDHHNLFGTFVTPRIHTLFNPGETTSIRLSAGKGTRLANVVIENTGVLASSRQLVFKDRTQNQAYGFKPDVAWNYGLNVSQDFTLNYRSGSVTFDYFLTDFREQVVVDLDRSAREVVFHSLNGTSRSNSLQLQVDYEPIRRFDLRLAYRYLDVRTQMLNGVMARPLIPKHRAFVNLAYETRNNWKFDLTTQWIGSQRIPGTEENPESLQLANYSDSYVLINTQVSKDLKSRWSIYLGVENVGNFKLDDPIVDAANPYGDYFDSSLVWGPVFGRMAYMGFRYRVK